MWLIIKCFVIEVFEYVLIQDSETVTVAENKPEEKEEPEDSEESSEEEQNVACLIDSSEEEKQADSDSLKDFIVEDEERKEGEEEEGVSETEDKNFRSHLPRQCEISVYYVFFFFVVKQKT